MEIFTSFLPKMVALFLVIILGFIARKSVEIERNTIAKLLFYIIVPLVFFHSTASLNIDPEMLALPLLTAGISGIIAYIIFYFTKGKIEDKTRAIFSFSSVNANVGYFLLPIVWQEFDQNAAGIFVLMVLGNAIYENTIGFFIAYQGCYSAKESLVKILKLPAIYGVILGLIFSYYPSLKVPNMLEDVFLNIRGSYSILGMMMIGIAIADIKELSLDLKFMSYSFLVKFIIWPLFSILLIMLDKSIFHLYDPITYKMLILFSVAPLAANNVVVASVLDLYPEKTSTSVVASTIFAVIYIPIVLYLVSL